MLLWHPALAQDAAHEASPPQVQPDLFLDGEALANEVTGRVLKQAYPGSPLDRDAIFFMRSRLYAGGAFGDMERPNIKKLTDWMLSKADGSILPHELLDKAIELENYSVQRALTLCWDLLRQDYTLAEQRNTYDYVLKLKDITGELELFDGQVHEQRRGGPLDRTDKRKRMNWALGRPENEQKVVSRTVRNLRGKSAVGIKTVRGDNFSAWYHSWERPSARSTGRHLLSTPFPDAWRPRP